MTLSTCLARAALAACAFAFFGAGAASASPTISASPGYDHPSGSVKVSGTGFSANEGVDIYFDSTDIGLAIADGSGNFSNIPVEVPSSANPGVNYLSGLGRLSGQGAQTEFDVYTDWTQYRYNQQRGAYNPYENVIGTGNVGSLDVAWTYQTGFGGDAFASPVAVVDGIVYGVSTNAVVFALNGTTGAPIWANDYFYTTSSNVAVWDGSVYFCAGSTMYGLSASNGSSGWNALLSGTCANAVAVSNGVAVVADTAGNLYAFNATTGHLNWQDVLGGTLSSPAIANGVVFVANGAETWGINLSTGGGIWDVPLTGETFFTPAVAAGRVVVGTGAGWAIALNAATGSIAWANQVTTNAMNSPATLAPTRFGPMAILGDNVSNIYAFSGINGNEIGHVAGSEAMTDSAIANGLLYAVSDRNVSAYDTSSGKLDWMGTTGGAVGAPVVANGMVYVPSADGNLYAYAINGGNNARKHRPRPRLSSLHPDLRLKPLN